MESAPYRWYMRWLYPVERWICGLWPGLLAFQFVILGRPVSVERLEDAAQPSHDREEVVSR
jgi:hypothetical protein